MAGLFDLIKTGASALTGGGIGADLLATAVSAGVDYYVAKQDAGAVKKAANNRAAMEQKRIDLLETEREMNTARETARVRREARGKAAVARARMGFFGLTKSSAATIGAQGAATGVTRETDFIAASSDLVSKGHELDRQQTEANRAVKIASAEQGVTTAGITGIADIAVESFKLANKTGNEETE